ncbi:hypothetical protein [Magnetococcus sp. PR-3]|uniref:hypothetical protein n=1 Tax=Magnetococcus sp. PR-3 TaxID=3120355 RepID=UPI002FCE543A
MTTKHDAFDACPAGREADDFHQRIFNGLQASFAELAERHAEIQAMPQPDAEESQFLKDYLTVQQGLHTLQDTELAYDQKLECARDLQRLIMDLELI